MDLRIAAWALEAPHTDGVGGEAIVRLEIGEIRWSAVLVEIGRSGAQDTRIRRDAAGDER